MKKLAIQDKAGLIQWVGEAIDGDTAVKILGMDLGEELHPGNFSITELTPEQFDFLKDCDGSDPAAIDYLKSCK